MYHTITSADLSFFESLLSDRCKSDLATREAYNHDHTEDLHFTPSVVLLPQNTQEVSLILAYCNKNNIPLINLPSVFVF
jgi:glycolate oxidase